MIAEAPELQAPPGTHQRLISLENGRLGNAVTRRFVCVTQTPHTWSDLRDNPNLTPDMAAVSLLIQKRGRPRTGEIYYFGINPADRVVLLAAWQFRGGEGRTDLEPPTLDFILREISIAERLQPELKRK